MYRGVVGRPPHLMRICEGVLAADFFIPVYNNWTCAFRVSNVCNVCTPESSHVV